MSAEKKPKRLTREQLLAITGDQLKEIERLHLVLENCDKVDAERRHDLTNLLGHNMTTISITQDGGYRPYARGEIAQPSAFSWLGISFKIGELTAHADTAHTQKELQYRGEEINRLQAHVHKLEHPELQHSDGCHCNECKYPPSRSI